MRISVLIGTDTKAKRYTARVGDNGFLTFDSYDELERATATSQWRIKRSWNVGIRTGGLRFDGVEMIPRPELPDDARKKLLASARKQIEWAKDA